MSLDIKRSPRRAQRGGFALGLIVGLLVGLALALGVALVVTKVPLPFVNKVPTRSAEQDAAESEKNRNWDPNAPLSGRTNAHAGSGVVSPAPTASAPATAASSATVRKDPAKDPAAILQGKVADAASAPGNVLSYFVQAGAFGDPDEAEQQRARLAMMGMEARVTPRQQGARTVYRVRVGAFDEKADAEAARERLASAGIDAALVRVQK